MPVLSTEVDTTSSTFATNLEVQSAAVAALNEQLELVAAGGGPRYVERHHERGKLLARERIELLLDPDSPFLELSPLAAWGTRVPRRRRDRHRHRRGVEGVECVIIAHDPTVKGGTMNPYTLKKNLRAIEIARENRLPVINLVESGGADLPTQAEIFIPGGPDLPRPHRSCRRWASRRSRWCSATPPPAAPTCPACATTW